MNVPDIRLLTELADKNPKQVSAQYDKYKNLEPSKGALAFYKVILRSSVISNDPDTAMKVSFKLSSPEWQNFDDNQLFKILNNLGVIYRKNQLYAQAIRAYKCGLRYTHKNDSAQIDILLNLHLSQKKLGLYDEALQSLLTAEYLTKQENKKRRIKQKRATLYIETLEYEKAQRLFIELFRDDSLRGTPEHKVRSGLNLLNSLILQGKYSQFWRYHNSVKQSIFDLKKPNHHYLYHYIIMESVVQAKILPSDIQFQRTAYVLERGVFLYPYGLKQSLLKYLKIVDNPMVTEHALPFMLDSSTTPSSRTVPEVFLDKFCA